MQALQQKSHAVLGSRNLQPCRVAGTSVLRQCRVHAVQKDTEISTKDWRAQRMTDKVHALFDRVWSKGEVHLIDDLITDDFVWKVGMDTQLGDCCQLSEQQQLAMYDWTAV